MPAPTDAPIVVTGGSGAIGRHVVDELLARGHAVVALTRRLADTLPRHERLSWVAADLHDVDALADLFKKHRVTYALHLAATILNKEGDLPGAVAANTHASACFFEAARRAGLKRVVYTSSKAVFGPLRDEYGHPQYRPVPEDHPRRPQSIYALTKCLTEDIAAFMREHYGLDVICVRFGTTAGPGKGPQHAGAAILSDIVEKPVHGLPVELASGGEQRDDIMYTLDVAQGLVTICLSEAQLSPVLHLDSGTVVSLRDIAEAVRREIPDAVIRIGDGLDYMGYGGIYGRLDSTRAQRETGYRSRFDLAGWVRDFITRVRSERGSTKKTNGNEERS